MSKIIVGAISFLAGSALGGYKVAEFCDRAMKVEEKRADKNNINFMICCKWLRGYQQGIRIKDYFEKNNIKEVAIYGMGELGRCVLAELGNTENFVKYVIDRSSYKAFGECPCYSPFDDLPEVQTIIVTPVSDFKVISEQLKRKTNALLIPINQILDELV